MENQKLESKEIRSENAKKAMEEKEYRTKLFQENKNLYKKAKQDFFYGVSQNFRQKRKNQKHETKQIEEETLQAYQEGGMYDN